ncbi:peptidase E [Flavivirga aquatica]|uniref:Peptidase E n=1 Tax=Flavivirga aquatica TaxID=1849968 RepID=A0A1E5TCJ1_9FLAO|nr:DUF6702 family protein [Flavivirga aquatica]OEK09057.1 peptidase E [Flavivirga aquatica]
MKLFKLTFILILLPLFAFTGIHKYYISVTQIDYIEKSRSIQITSRVFIDDFEALLRERFDENITLADKDESVKNVNFYTERYLKEKIKIKVNDKLVNLVFLGKEYDGDIMRFYLEIEKIEKIESIEIINRVLFDLFEDQQNIVKTKINSKQKSFILIPQKDKALLKFI